MPHAPAVDRARDLISQGRHAQAEQALRRHAASNPGDLFACYLLAFVLTALGKAEQALYFAERAVKDPRADAAAFDLLGTLLMQQDRKEDAHAAFRRAVDLDPNHASALNGLGTAAFQTGRLDEGVESARRVLALAPENPDFIANAAQAFSEAWLDGEQLAFLRDAVARHPNHLRLRTYFTGLLNYSDAVAPMEVFEHHRALGRLIESRVPVVVPPARRASGRPLRVGLISPDFRQHPIAAFLEPLLREVGMRGSIRGELEILCYSAHEEPDPVTARLRSLVGDTHWRDVAKLDDCAVASAVRGDEIDVLIDLAGHTVGSRLAVLAHRPAPVQGTYLGYPNTTGMSRVDFRIVDSITDPSGTESQATERLIRLDSCFLCFQSPANELPTRPPRLADDVVTFVSFNLLTKVTPTTVRLWSEVLRVVPRSRLLLKAKALGHASVQDRVSAAFASEGIDPARVEMLGWVASLAEHAALYERADIALDSYPYHGTTTTCDALSMGVPVVTLVGPTHASRVGASILSAVGLEDLIAKSRDEFIAIASRLAADVDHRNMLRAALRERFVRSPVCDAPGFARRFVDAICRIHSEFAMKNPRM
jgi:predicted O-linked N-acetylglucosamine transferase (SPINDLY family)